MDNTQIRHSLCGNATGFYRISEVETLMELARADERAKIQGVDVWISWDGLKQDFELWVGSDYAASKFGGIVDYRMADALGVEPKGIAKFKIVRCV